MIDKIIHEIEAEQITEIDTVNDLKEVYLNYMKRKYMTEAGLGVSLNHHTLVLANRLTEQEKIDPYQYHIYSIMCGDKVYFDDKETGIVTENGLTGLKVVFFSFDEKITAERMHYRFCLIFQKMKKLRWTTQKSGFR